MKRVFLFVCMFLSLISVAKKWDATYISKLIAKGGIDKVIQYYQDRYYSPNRDPQDAFRIADLYVKKKEYATAMQWYNKESQLINSSKINLFNYAYASQLTGEYQKALDAYLMYAAMTGDVNKVMDLANQCERILKASAQVDNYKLESYTFNTSADELQLAVLRTNPVYVTVKNPSAGEDKIQYRILQAVREYDGFAEPVKAVNPNALKLIITGLSYTSDGNKVVFAAKADNTNAKKAAKAHEQLYVADNLGGNLLNIQPLPFNQEGYTFRQPAFNTDGTEIYFSSNLPDGSGGFDIWKSRWVNNNWSKPSNLGKLLNSMADEISPFMVQDGKDKTLYFSSNRDGGFGGFDIYAADGANNVWQDVQLQPAPINSAGDEVSILFDKTINTGYVTSDRAGGKGGFDMYRFIPFDLKLIVQVSDSVSGNAVDYAFLKLSESKNDNRIVEGVTDANGRAVFQVARDKNFTVNISKDNYKPLTIVTHSFGKSSTDSIVEAVQLNQNSKFSILNNATNQLSLENYIIFTGKIMDGATNKPVKNAKMRMVNYTTQKLREIDIDKDGRYQLKLLLNNNYKVIFEQQENKITDELSTYGLEKYSVKVKDYILTGNTFVTTTNKVYARNNVPAYIKIDQDGPSDVVVNKSVHNEPITQSKVDSLLKVISKDEPSKVSWLDSKTANASKEITEAKKEDRKEPAPEVKTTETIVEKIPAPAEEIKSENTEVKQEKVLDPKLVEQLFEIDTTPFLPIPDSYKPAKLKLINRPDISYKIQIGSFLDDNIEFPQLSGLGKIEKIKSFEQYIYRLGEYYDIAEAKAVLEKVRAQNYFVAFILQFTKGKVSNIIK